MAKKSSKKVNQLLADDELAKRPTAVPPLDEGAPASQGTRQSETVATEIQTGKPSAKATAAETTPHLLTPLAAVWPTAALPESPQLPVAAAGIAQATIPTATKTVNVSFALLEPNGKRVALAGDFNGWAADAMPMQRKEGGVWETTIPLAPGRYQYKFIVEGVWIPDPLAQENVWNQHGTLNSVIEVRA